MQNKGRLYMIPVPLAENAWHTLSSQTFDICRQVRFFYVEHIREARRFLKGIDKGINIDELCFAETHKNTIVDTSMLSQWLNSGHDVGVLSDAGCPGIADPGAQLAAKAHEIGAKVIPVSGPSSITLALMASGLNGQHFQFNGYLPVKEPQRSQHIKNAENVSAKENSTQIFIETPYRNNSLLQDLLKYCNGNSYLSIALNISNTDEWIKTQSVSEWRKNRIELAKQPAIFLLLGR